MRSHQRPTDCRAPGTYALVLHLRETRSIIAGKLGNVPAPAGFFTYVGSAFGPGGVAGRVRRHLRPGRSPHWHIDYLRPVAPIVEVWHSYDPAPREHEWARQLATMTGRVQGLRGFGSSDCTCPTHLFHSTEPPSLSEFTRRILEVAPDHQPVHRTSLASARQPPNSDASLALSCGPREKPPR
jgi:Uri superfamily endonuclease